MLVAAAGPPDPSSYPLRRGRGTTATEIGPGGVQVHGVPTAPGPYVCNSTCWVHCATRIAQHGTALQPMYDCHSGALSGLPSQEKQLTSQQPKQGRAASCSASRSGSLGGVGAFQCFHCFDRPCKLRLCRGLLRLYQAGTSCWRLLHHLAAKPDRSGTVDGMRLNKPHTRVCARSEAQPRRSVQAWLPGTLHLDPSSFIRRDRLGVHSAGL